MLTCRVLQCRVYNGSAGIILVVLCWLFACPPDIASIRVDARGAGLVFVLIAAAIARVQLVSIGDNRSTSYDLRLCQCGR